MAEVLYELVSSSNFAQTATQAFHRPTRNIVSWESTEFAIAPIDILFKLQSLTFVTELYLHPKKGKSIRMLQVIVSEDNQQYSPIAKIYDFNDAVRVQVSGRCRYIKMVVVDKEQGRPASIDLLRIYGHSYSNYGQDIPLHSQKQQKVDEILIQEGFNRQQQWQVDEETLATLYDMSKMQREYTVNGEKEKLTAITKDFKTVLKLGEQIKQLQIKRKYINAKQQFEQIKDINDEIARLRQRRDFYDQKYQTRRYEQMIALDDYDNRHDQLLKNLLEKDMQQLEEQRKRREEQAMQREKQLNQEFENLEKEAEWWNKQHELDNIQEQKQPKPKVEKTKPPPQTELDEDYKFKNPYVYNQGDADMEKYIRPLLAQIGGDYVADPQLLRKYEQLQYLDVLGARIWISAHSQNWRQRAAAVEAVVNFAQDKLPQRYREGRTRNLFLALMEFSRINAEDKVLQIYYSSLKLMAVALQPPICGEDVSPVLINRSIQKFMSILVEKISEMNARAKQFTLKHLITVFRHPAADLGIAINECLKICREDLNLKFIPVDKQNPRLVLSRIEIIGKLMENFKFEKRKVDFGQILRLLVEGALYHNSGEVRVAAVKILEEIYKQFPQGTVQWYKNLKGLKPNIAAELQQKLKIK